MLVLVLIDVGGAPQYCLDVTREAARHKGPYPDSREVGISYHLVTGLPRSSTVVRCSLIAGQYCQDVQRRTAVERAR